MKNKKLEIALYIAGFVLFCILVFFTGFIIGFRTGIEKGTFIGESGIREMRRGHFNKPPLPFMQGRKHMLKNKEDILFFLDGADKNTNLTINMLQDQIAIANKRNYSTGKLTKILEDLKEERIEIGTIKQSILSGNATGNLFDEDDKTMGNLKKVMQEIREELDNLQKHINQSKNK